MRTRGVTNYKTAARRENTHSVTAKENMEVSILFLLVAVILAHDASAQIPIPCANEESLAEGKCCPTPNIEGADACGQNVGRGSCQLVSIQRTLNEEQEGDVRVNWPLLYFNQTCVCNFRYGGFDCGECSYDYNDGTDECKKKTVRPRLSAATMDDNQWKDYTAALEQAKNRKSRYMVVTTNYTTNVRETVNSMVNPTHYDLFIWMHHLVSKDSDVTRGKRQIHQLYNERSGYWSGSRMRFL